MQPLRAVHSRPLLWFIWTVRFQQRYLSPKLYAMVTQLSGALFCLLIIGTVKVDRANEVAVFVENVGAVVRHGMDPRLVLE